MCAFHQIAFLKSCSEQKLIDLAFVCFCCVCACVVVEESVFYVCVCCVHACWCGSRGVQRLTSGAFLSQSSSLTELELNNSAKFSSPQAPRLLLSVSPALGLQACTPFCAWLCIGVLGISTWVLMLA